MSREVHVRFCERRGVRFPPPTLLDLALHPGELPDQLPAFLHFGFQLPDANAVRELLVRMEVDGVPILERWDESGYVAFKCLDPDGWRVEAYWEPVGQTGESESY
jgi:hypothetical protein